VCLAVHIYWGGLLPQFNSLLSYKQTHTSSPSLGETFNFPCLCGGALSLYDARVNQSQQLHTTTNRLVLRGLSELLSSPLTSASGISDGDDLSVSFSPPGSGSPEDDEAVSELLSVGIVGTEKEVVVSQINVRS
jgi:hypothetical protein